MKKKSTHRVLEIGEGTLDIAQHKWPAVDVHHLFYIEKGSGTRAIRVQLKSYYPPTGHAMPSTASPEAAKQNDDSKGKGQK